MTVTLYSKPACTQCKFTQRELDKTGIEYEIIDLSQDPQALEYVQQLGYLQAPVVQAGADHWSGFKPDRIRQVAQQLQLV